ncbi:MAG: hypothetical protein H8E66_26300 [Planctomycetes bacterium]|nr:hypothetical protein [Planctomycetota bacterium]
MTIKPQIHTELNRLASLAATGPHALCIDLVDGRLEATLTQIDPLACAFEYFSYKTGKLANATVDQLKDIANTLSTRLSYLLESISPIEIDDEACVVQMRSNPPQKDDDGTRYYELVVTRGELNLCRYSRPSGRVRRVVSANVTREVFERLVEDFVAAVA